MKQRVMIVDDEALLVKTLSQAFRDAGYEVTAAGTAEDAERILDAKERFDLLLLDNRLPGKSGVELLAGRASRPAKRVVLMTAYASDDIEQKSIDLGVDLYLRKPFDLGMLLSQASKLLEKGAET
ncbi:MAG: response regulator [Candidatus Eisenbacteria sp.]|nr:response regulator [Candidatus Eisenbacteria bacterium]